MGMADLYNDADLERELELLAQEEITHEMTKIAPLPDVPNPSTTIKTNQQVDDLKQLEAWAQ